MKREAREMLFQLMRLLTSKRNKTVWDMRQHQTWGDHIQWTSWERRRVNGWTEPLPEKGDELIAEMASGRLGRFRFAKVEPCGDPSDMWFATVEDMGYVE